LVGAFILNNPNSPLPSCKEHIHSVRGAKLDIINLRSG
jgi:hypothetical protein